MEIKAYQECLDDSAKACRSTVCEVKWECRIRRHRKRISQTSLCQGGMSGMDRSLDLE